MKTRLVWSCTLLALSLCFVGCSSAVYSTYEKFGVYKRDLLKKAVLAARDDQEEASEQFKDALTRIRELYQVKGGDLERTYDALQSDFDRSEAKANDVRERIRKVETVSSDLFAEWEREIKEISSADLQARSRRQLRETRARYDDLHSTLKRAEKSMEPVLTQFRDHVLYLKHNLNAEAIGAIRGEALDIQNEISQLIKEMNTSIAEADRFLQTLDVDDGS